MRKDNDPRPGRPRSSPGERSIQLVIDVLEEGRRATCEELSRATGAKSSQENAQEPTSVARGWATLSVADGGFEICGGHNVIKDSITCI